VLFAPGDSTPGWLSTSPDLFENVGRRHAERGGDPLNDADGWIAAAALQVADIGPMNAGLVGELLLRQPFGLAQASKIPAQPLTYIHIPMSVEMSTSGLQTMSNISLDFAVDKGRKARH
jgi:hypothetical protein